MKFYSEIKGRLGYREKGFDLIFDYLKNIKNPLIVETGCARQKDNYFGDGQSSVLFDRYIDEYGGKFITVDISEQSVEYCKSRVISPNTNVVLHDSIIYLKILNEQLQSQNKKIDFLYLDSFDAPKEEPKTIFNSALHHLYEFTTILPSLKKGSLIGVDDNWIENGSMDGKGRFVLDYMNKIECPLIYNGYQLFWIFK
jgi:hypothetical protein